MVPSVSLKVLGKSRVDLERPVMTFTLPEGNIQVQSVTGSHWSFPFCLPRPSWVSLTCPTRRGESLERGRGGHHIPRPSWALEAGQRLQGVHTCVNGCSWGAGKGTPTSFPDSQTLVHSLPLQQDMQEVSSSIPPFTCWVRPSAQAPAAPPLLGGLAQETS